MTRVVIIDDHRLFREGLISLLNSQENITIVGEFDNANDFLRQCSNLKVDVALLDMDMPGMNGIETAKLALQSIPDLKIVMISMHDNYTTIQEAFKAGVKAYLFKTSNENEVLEAIELAMEGKDFITDSVTKKLVEGIRQPESLNKIDFTPREKQILQLICAELSTKEIADKLYISENTVETHRKNMMAKTGAKNVIGLVKLAIQQSLD
jgi:DNA-binding NarL/FixJ family response regulator